MIINQGCESRKRIPACRISRGVTALDTLQNQAGHLQFRQFLLAEGAAGMDQGVVTALKFDEGVDDSVEIFFHCPGIESQIGPFKAGGFALAGDARLELAQGVLAVENEHPIAGADGFAFGLGEPTPFAVAFFEVAVGVHGRING